jgi:predicted phosphohydrolase
MAKAFSSEAGTGSRKENASKQKARAGSRRTQLKYLVGGNHEGAWENLGRITAAAALRKARQLLQQGYLNVRICTPRGQVLLSDEFNHLEEQEETDMAKGERRGNREAKKPKKEKIKVIAAAPSQKAATGQPSFMPGRKK